MYSQSVFYFQWRLQLNRDLNCQYAWPVLKLTDGYCTKRQHFKQIIPLKIFKKHIFPVSTVKSYGGMFD